MNYVSYYAESIGDGRAVMRCDVVVDGKLVPELSGVDGSPAPLETVRKYERRVTLCDGNANLSEAPCGRADSHDPHRI